MPALRDAGLNCSVAFYVVMLPILYVVLPEMYCVWIAVDTECQVLPEKQKEPFLSETARTEVCGRIHRK